MCGERREAKDARWTERSRGAVQEGGRAEDTAALRQVI